MEILKYSALGKVVIIHLWDNFVVLVLFDEPATSTRNKGMYVMQSFASTHSINQPKESKAAPNQIKKKIDQLITSQY